MKSPDRVAWLEGAELYPQHLQQQDLFHEQLLDLRLGQVVPHAWGVARLELDPAALGLGQIRVLRFEGAFPDGATVVFDAGDALAPGTRSIEGQFGPTQKALEVFLALPRERFGVPSYVEKRERSGARYTLAPRATADVGGTAPEQQVAFARPNLEILLGNENRGEAEVVKIAEIVRDSRGGLLYDERFIPPALRIGATPYIINGLDRLLSLAVAKQRDLSRALRQGEGSGVEFGAGDVTRFLQVFALNSAIPMLGHLATSPELSPRTAYLSLAQLYGQLTTFVIDADPADLPAYSFTDLGVTFEELFARITQLLHATVREQYVGVTMQARDGRLLAALNDPRFDASPEVYLAVRSDLPEAQIAERFGRLARVASASDIVYLQRANASGAALRYVAKPPPEIPVRAGVIYFAVSAHDVHWQGVLRDRTLAVVLPAPFNLATTQVEVMAVPRR
jgi:type VI secretion system protein ImpJ